MKHFYFALFVFILSFNSCSEPSGKNSSTKEQKAQSSVPGDSLPKEKAPFNAPDKGKASDFGEAALQFIQALNSKDSQAIARFIHPEYGFFVLNNPGALTYIYHFDTFEQLRSLSNQPEHSLAGRLQRLNIDCDTLQTGELPHYSCETGWDKTGCYGGDKQELKLTVYYPYLKENPNIKIEPGDIELASKLEKLTSKGIYSTSSKIGIYFMQLDNRWYITTIDLVLPCSA